MNTMRDQHLRRRRPGLAGRIGLNAQSTQGPPPWTVIYGDLVTLLLAFFILLYTFSSINEARFRETLTSLQSAFGIRTPLATELGGVFPADGGVSESSLTVSQGQVRPLPGSLAFDEAAMDNLRATIAQGLRGQAGSDLVGLAESAEGLVIRLDATLLFDSGSAAIRQEATPVLDAVGLALAAISYPVRIEGHSDGDPMIPNPQYPDNWTLSGARAANVLRYLHEFAEIPYERISYAGYADTRPVGDNVTAEGKARNRRVEILVLGR